MCASPRGAPAAILAVSFPHIDARADLRGGCLQRFCRRRNFVRHRSRVIVSDSPLKTELPGVLKGVTFGASRGKAVLYTPTGLLSFFVETEKKRAIALV
jgi:hypothetical protein